MIALIFIIIVSAMTLLFLGVQIVSAIENHKSTRGVTIYRIDEDGNLKEIKRRNKK